jgi:hypothetical protein
LALNAHGSRPYALKHERDSGIILQLRVTLPHYLCIDSYEMTGAHNWQARFPALITRFTSAANPCYRADHVVLRRVNELDLTLVGFQEVFRDKARFSSEWHAVAPEQVQNKNHNDSGM